MSTTLLAVAPIFLLILLGWALRRGDFPASGFWPMAEALTYYVLFPALLLDTCSRAAPGSAPVGRMALALVLAVCGLCVLLVAARRLVHPDGPAFTSVLQGAIRPNTYVGLAAASALLGREGVSLAAMALLTLIPLVNVLAVAALGAWGAGREGAERQGEAAPRSGLVRILRELARNPLILSCIAGYAISIAGLTLPKALSETLRILGGSSLPLGLLAVGAGFQFSSVGRHLRGVAVSSAAKLLALPLLAFAACRLLGVDGPALAVAVIFTAIPVSASSFILARQLGGDHGLMAAIITAQTVAAALTMPLIFSLLPLATGG